MTELRVERSEWTSFGQLVHELMGGAVRRNTFTRWELDLLLDLQTARIRKSSRPELLRKYLKAVNRDYAQGAPAPQRFSIFLESQVKRRPAPEPPAAPFEFPRAS